MSNQDFVQAPRDGRGTYLEKVTEAYERYQETGVIHYPEWLYGPPKGELFRVEVEDCPEFGETAELEFDSGRTAFLSIDMQQDFCGYDGYVDTMGYDLGQTRRAVEPIKEVLETVRRTEIDVVHTREGHDPQLADAPFNKLLRSKMAGDGHGIGETPPGGVGPLLTRGHENWDIIDELAPEAGEPVVDKPTKGAFGNTNIDMVLNRLGATHLVIAGITTDVCVHTIMREANDRGYWCTLLKDATGATDPGNRDAAIKSVKMQGGVFGWVSDTERFTEAVESALV
ncbi:cysteine hydrolase [Haloarcula sp. S1CR25-12]|uniref:Cysteine hydrolase n=1 Tax=Haloarcula saliterrae TaxID=2950534 RepID=A0ABU2FE73_9EURY|nr:cysteine hydrolase [Haloarcula sp. S1CR25-12]MDS0260567.1 cysteine hydrolase [Haloarcula sp. S1CR25-12]